MTQFSLGLKRCRRSRYKRVRRCDVSWRVSIHRDRSGNGAKAISWSSLGRACCPFALRMKRSRAVPAGCPGNVGSQRVAGATDAGGKNLRGPVRRSYRGAIDLRQLPAACSRSEGLSENCTSFSASAKVAAQTTGPPSGAVPNAGGEPGVATGAVAFCVGLRQAARPAMRTVDARFRNPRREFAMSPLFLLLEGPVVLSDELSDFIRHPQELLPLLPIECDRKASEPIYGEPALLAHFQRHLTPRGLLQCRVLGAKPLDFRLQIFFRCHEYH